MALNDTISRRNLFLRSFGVRKREDERAPKETSPGHAIEDFFPDPSAVEDVTPEKILKRIDAEPAYRLVLPRLLAFCSEPRSAQEIHDELMYFPEMRTAAHDPKMLLKWMVEAGAITRRSMEEGTETALWLTTEAGLDAIAANDPGERLRRLLEDEPAYVDIYKKILEFCSVERSMPEIEYLLIAHPGLQSPRVYPSYMVDRLEFAGAIEWAGKWRVTETGKGILL